MTAGRAPEITLQQYAAILAGVAEGHQLARVLAREGVEPARWPDAEEAWSDRVAREGGVDSRLLTELDEHLAAAQDRYGRRLPPIDEDLRAFLDFRHHWTTNPDPRLLLASTGVRLDEVARLSRIWSVRLAASAELAGQAQKILGDEPGPMSIVTPVAIELPPAPTTVAPVESMRDDDETDEDESDMADMAIPSFAPVASAGEQAPASKGSPASASRAGSAALPALGRVAIRAKPSFLLTRDFVAPIPKTVLPFQAGNEKPAAGQPPPVKRAPPSLGSTTSFTAPLRAPALPFSKNAEPAATAPAAPMVPPQTSAPAREALTGTASFQGVSLASILPFAQAGGTEPLPIVPARPPPALAMTAAVSSVVAGPALPFAGAAADKPPTKLTLGQYAAFCAELSAFPDQIEETFRRYRLASAKEGVELAAAWQERFQQSSGDYTSWQRLNRFYLEQCRTKGRPETAP